MTATTTLTTNGTTQTVTLPKEFHLPDGEVFINKIDDVLFLIPKNKKHATLMNSINKFTADFMTTRDQPNQQERESFE